MPYSKEEKARKKAEQFREQDVQDREVNNNDPDGAAGGDDHDDPNMRPCCVPSTCLEGGSPVNIQGRDEVEKVVCNNPDCHYSSYMHKICFQMWEEEMLGFLRSCGRARSWSEKQRRQNLWTKKGYDLAWKACSCKCGKGHLRKDLDWIPPLKPAESAGGEGGGKKQKRRKKSNDKPTIGRATSLPSGNGRHRHASASSNETHDTPPASPCSKNFSPGQSPRNHGTATVIHGAVGGVITQASSGNKQKFEEGGFERSKHPSGGNNNSHHQNRSGPGSRHNSGGFNSGHSLTDSSHSNNPRNSGSSYSQSQPTIHPGAINKSQAPGPNGYNTASFLHRLDLSAFFQVLPQSKLNPYHIKMEDDSHLESDDIRPFIFSVLNSQNLSSVSCSLCHFRLPVFDRYPLIDGTFYLSPMRHSDGSIRVVIDGRSQFLGAVCMKCLEGVQHIVCRICNSRWDGSHHQLGTLYSYDIFAASPCCPGRVSCKKCGKPVIDPTHGTHFFSEYSQNIRCPHCGVPDFHFIKPLSSYEVHLREVGVC